MDPASIGYLVGRHNPWRPFTPPMKATYSRTLRSAQAHQNARLVRTAVAAHSGEPLPGNVISLTDYRRRKGA